MYCSIFIMVKWNAHIFICITVISFTMHAILSWKKCRLDSQTIVIVILALLPRPKHKSQRKSLETLWKKHHMITMKPADKNPRYHHSKHRGLCRPVYHINTANIYQLKHEFPEALQLQKPHISFQQEPTILIHLKTSYSKVLWNS